MASLPRASRCDNLSIDRGDRTAGDRLVACGGKAQDLPIEALEANLAVEDIHAFLTPKEMSFFQGQDDGQRAAMSWSVESALVLIWALGIVETLDRPDRTCDVDMVLSTVQYKGLERLIAESDRRSEKELLDERDVIFRYHWAVRNEMIRGRPAPAGLDGSVVPLRHWAFNWLARDNMDGPDWDNVTTDT